MGATASGGVRIGLVLSAGGLRGVAHLGVMRRLAHAGIAFDVVVGVSAGAIFAAYYAGCGLTIDDIISEAPTFKGQHLVMHGLTMRAPQVWRPFMRRFCGVVPQRLAQMEAGRFDRLHHGVSCLGIVCHDAVTNAPVYFSSLDCEGIRMSDVARASAAIPYMMPARVLQHRDRMVKLVDGGLSDPLPVAFARDVLGATHIIASDCCKRTPGVPSDPHVVHIRPALEGMATMRRPAGTLMETMHRGEQAVTDEMIQRIQAWRHDEARLTVGA
jgi:NTE family protein